MNTITPVGRFTRSPFGRDTLLARPMNLTEQEKTDLVNFMEALTDKRFAGKLQHLKRAQAMIKRN